MDNFITIGVTGGIGSGKSYVCRIIEAMGYPVFYSDHEAKNILNTDNELIDSVKALFGEAAYIKNELNRKFVAAKIFDDSSLREKLNALVHPKVREAFSHFCEKHQPGPCAPTWAFPWGGGCVKNDFGLSETFL